MDLPTLARPFPVDRFAGLGFGFPLGFNGAGGIVTIRSMMRRACGGILAGTRKLPPGYETLATAIGMAVIMWARAERCLDICVVYLYDNGGKAIDPELPTRSVRRKARFVRRCCRELTLSDDERAGFLDIADTLAKNANLRHWCTHGATARIAESELGARGRFELTDFTLENTVEGRTITTDEITGLALTAATVTIAASEFFGNVLGIWPKVDIDKAFSELGVKKV